MNAEKHFNIFVLHIVPLDLVLGADIQKSLHCQNEGYLRYRAKRKPILHI
jgi:hypothetical protein